MYVSHDDFRCTILCIHVVPVASVCLSVGSLYLPSGSLKDEKTFYPIYRGLIVMSSYIISVQWRRSTRRTSRLLCFDPFHAANGTLQLFTAALMNIGVESTAS